MVEETGVDSRCMGEYGHQRLLLTCDLVTDRTRTAAIQRGSGVRKPFDFVVIS